MGRPKVDTEAVARVAFQTEVRVKRAFYNIPQRYLAEVLDIGGPRMSALLQNPDDISAGRLREIIKLLHLDPKIVLQFLGYTGKELRKEESG